MLKILHARQNAIKNWGHFLVKKNFCSINLETETLLCKTGLLERSKIFENIAGLLVYKLINYSDMLINLIF